MDHVIIMPGTQRAVSITNDRINDIYIASRYVLADTGTCDEHGDGFKLDIQPI